MYQATGQFVVGVLVHLIGLMSEIQQKEQVMSSNTRMLFREEENAKFFILLSLCTDTYFQSWGKFLPPKPVSTLSNYVILYLFKCPVLLHLHGISTSALLPTHWPKSLFLENVTVRASLGTLGSRVENFFLLRSHSKSISRITLGFNNKMRLIKIALVFFPKISPHNLKEQMPSIKVQSSFEISQT